MTPPTMPQPPAPTPFEIRFGFLIEFRKPMMRPDEAARILGRSINYVYACIETGDLEAHKPKNREVNRYTVTRRSVALHLAETATYRSEDFLCRVKALLGELDAKQLDALITDASALRRRKFVA